MFYNTFHNDFSRGVYISLILKETAFQHRNIPDRPKEKKLLQQEWAPPPKDVLKFNVDSAMRADGGGGEILAIKYTLELFLESMWARKAELIIECDCKSVINWLLHPVSTPPEKVDILRPIVTTIVREKVVVKFAPRICNMKADELAKLALGAAPMQD
ncbi:hypothetical protein F3Y22_tig00110303pilonHSYRG00214 [Hibiscus syriacus]|uniref:RNase H type-1 domain-containing protein n=1 Tax=Hibiscus syriacus TaxID=106335 RepID=A0A6A3B4C3_HIBSY|nr:hypothetical protein F3Y22_tig00110303pilonHSYRG00214 [Hibiscus syriacus]